MDNMTISDFFTDLEVFQANASLKLGVTWRLMHKIKQQKRQNKAAKVFLQC